jgi:hypothetical protein
MHDESARQKGNRARTLGANKETLAPTGSGKILGRVDSRETSAPTECRDAESTEAGSVRESGEVGDDGAVKTVPWAIEIGQETEKPTTALHNWRALYAKPANKCLIILSYPAHPGLAR